MDGPFSAAQELIADFSIWEVADMDEAVAWARRCPNVMPGRSELESGRSSRWPISVAS